MTNKRKDELLLAALNNPLRRQILRRMRDEEAVSPRKLAAEFHLPISNMAYHVRVLAECGAITLDRVKPVRGSIEHFYRSTLRPPWARQIVDLSQAGFDGDPETRIPTWKKGTPKPCHDRRNTPMSCSIAGPGWSSTPAVPSPT